MPWKLSGLATIGMAAACSVLIESGLDEMEKRETPVLIALSEPVSSFLIPGVQCQQV